MCMQKFGLPDIEDFAYKGPNELTQCSKYIFAKVWNAGVSVLPIFFL
jgi:hypothetical protein